MAAVVDRALDLLAPDESAVVLFTRGSKFEKSGEGSGSTGNWVFKPREDLDRVIVYNQLRDGRQPDAEIWIADYVTAVASNQPDRFVVHFKDAYFAGRAGSKWREFADTYANPVRLISKRS
jgi:hypothetical protein